MNDLLLNVFGGITMAGMGVAFMNIHEAIFLCMGIFIILLSTMIVLSLPQLKHTFTTWSFIAELFSGLGYILVLFGLMLFYILHCLFKNKEYITHGNMPDSWYKFSYYVVGVSALNILSIIAYLKNKTLDKYKALSILLTTILLGFILIETIICSYFRTDGFTI